MSRLEMCASRWQVVPMGNQLPRPPPQLGYDGRMEVAPKRHWFSFSLRTLLVAIGIGGLFLGWLTWNWRIVQERKECLQLLKVTGHEIYKRTKTLAHADEHYYHPMPFPRNLMGDTRIVAIYFAQGFRTDEVARIRKAFPEAQIIGDPE